MRVPREWSILRPTDESNYDGAMQRSRKIGIASLIVFAVGFLLPAGADILFPGQDPAGKAMASGFLAMVCCGIAMVLAITAFVFSFGKQEKRDIWTILLGRGPLVLIVVASVAGVIVAINFG